MYFQISPVIRKKTKPVPQNQFEDDDSKIETLSLAPFTSNPKIVFNNVAIGTTQVRKLLVRNPTGQNIHLFIKRPIPEEINLVLSWEVAVIEKESELLLEMTWTPTCEEACRHTFILSDGKRINRDIAVTFKSVNPKLVKRNGNSAKPLSSAVTLPLIRKSISPDKNLRTQLRRNPLSPGKKLKPKRKSPRKNTFQQTRSSAHVSPPQKYQDQQRLEYKICKEAEFISQTQQVYNFRSSAWENENNHLKKTRFDLKENKENVSPLPQRFLCNVSGCFISPTNATFLMENEKNYERRDTYNILDPISERRGTYILQTHKLENIVEPNATFEMQNKYMETTESVYLGSEEKSPSFRDSLESPVSILPLGERNAQNEGTPSLESMLNKNTNKSPRSPLNFQLKVQNFTLSPATSPYNSTVSSSIFIPTICSTSSKPPNDSYKNTGTTAVELFSQPNIVLDGSNETYTKINASSETYVKDNSSFETYVKGNLSTGTYTKDNSFNDIHHLDVSPVSTRSNRVPSPLFLKPKSFEFSQVAEYSRSPEPRLPKNLSAIVEEESGIFNEAHLKIGSKRKSASFDNEYTKRERLSIESKKCWARSGGSAMRIARRSSGLNLKSFTSTSQDKTQPLSSISETISKTLIVKNPFLFANIIDPFMTSQIYHDEKWIDQQENNFKKWLNALLTPPDGLSTKNEVDVAKVWQECIRKDVSEAPTKEMISLNYHTNRKLDYLRRQAQQLFRSKNMSTVLQKVCLVVESGKLSIREDKDLHLNLKLKSDIIQLILSYNPLWLRIGLETVFNEIIPLKSNSDTQGLASFLLERFLKDPYLMRKHKTVYAPKYASDLKKFLLKKFLILVYFLDQAKNEKLIQHDPCLFCKNAIEKESKLVLIHFARETLSAVGDIVKYLRCLGYIVTHAQSYIHEFDYAVKNLGVDLRDGVRLTRVMEIIQIRNDLTTKLRVPAISRLQKVHNVQLVFKSLQESGYEIQYEISAKDIVDGHKEKTLSFLWQIIYKFEAPLMVKSATTIQTWFGSLPVLLKRRTLTRKREERKTAAKKIQLWYRRQKLSGIYFAVADLVYKSIEERRRLRAVIKIQSFCRMRICRRGFLKQHSLIIKLQGYARGWLIRHSYRRRIDASIIIQKYFRGFTCRRRFLQRKFAVITLQRKYRAQKQMKQSRLAYGLLRRATLTIQKRFRAIREMKVCQKNYTTLRRAAIKIQSFFRMYVTHKRFTELKTATKILQIRYRAKQQMQASRTDYLNLRKTTIFVQRRFRANLKMKTYRNAFTALRRAVILIQSFYRMYYLRKQFIRLRLATLIIQSRYKAHIAMKTERNKFLLLRNYVVCVQRRFRANLEMKRTKKCFGQLKNAALQIQTYYRMYVLRKRYCQLQKAVRIIQQRYRAQKAMQQYKYYFVALRRSVLTIQRRIRANNCMQESRRRYTHIRQSIIVIQAHFRMYTVRKKFLEFKRVTVFVQRRFLAQKSMKEQKERYQKLRNSTLIFQRRWRARQLYLQEKTRFDKLKRAAITTQQRYRAKRLMLLQRQKYSDIRGATIKIQTWYKSIMAMRICRQKYTSLKNSVATIERRYLELKSMRIARANYEAIQNGTRVIQLHYRALVQMRTCRHSYLELKSTTLAIQRRYRANKLMQKHQTYYQKLKTTAVFVQNMVRANRTGKLQRNRFLLQKNSIVKIQRWYRATLETRKCRNFYIRLKRAVTITEIRYQAKQLMEREKRSYECLRTATLTIQRRYKGLLETRRLRQRYIELRNAVILIQRIYRANVSARTEYQRYQRLRKATLFVQRKYRAKKAMLKCKMELISLRKSTIFIQRKYRAQKQMVECREKYQCLRSACLWVQGRYRARKLMLLHSQEYQVLKKVVCRIQQRFRANVLARKERLEYNLLRNAVVVIQRRFRAQVLMKTQRNRFVKLLEASITIQRKCRAISSMKEKRTEFVTLRKATVTVQTRYRALTLMKRQKIYFENLRKATIFVQRRYRANKVANACRLDYLKLRHAAVVLQRRYRARYLTIQCVTQYSRFKWAVLVIQRRYKAEMAMKKEMLKYKTLRYATFILQRKIRATILSRIQRRWFLAFKKSVNIIQSHYRSYLKMKRQRESYLIIRSAVVNLQRFARGYITRKKFAPLLTPEAVEARRLLKIQTAAAIKIQAFWRGCSVRKSNIPVMVALSERREHRVVEASSFCQGKTLAQRCEAAMLCMTAKYSSLLIVIRALEDIDFITRHSQNLCIRLSLILPYQLYIIITSAARSLPEMNTLKMATQILINFCKYPQTRKNSWDPDHVDALINIILHWCDKDVSLFPTMCTLLWLFAQEDEWKKVILALPNIKQRFNKIQSLVYRKQNMVIKSKKVNNNSVFGPLVDMKLPTTTANWGLDYDRPNVFTNAVFALINLMKVLDL